MPKHTFPAQYAILGLLSNEPLHGYALRKRIDATLSPFWSIATSQIYSALHLMQQNGLVEVRSLKKYGRPQREVYMITPMGKRAFKQWCESPVSHFRDMRVEFLAKLYFLFQSSKQGALSLIESQKLYLDRLLARILRHNHSLTDNPTFSILAKSFRVYQIRACIEWLEECERRIKTI